MFNPKTASNFIMGEIAAYLKEEKVSIEESKLSVENFVKLLKLLEKAQFQIILQNPLLLIF